MRFPSFFGVAVSVRVQSGTNMKNSESWEKAGPDSYCLFGMSGMFGTGVVPADTETTETGGARKDFRP